MVIKDKTFSIVTLGCRLNIAESSSIRKHMEDKSFKYKENQENVETIIINTCCVTNKAETKSKYYINHFRKNKKIKNIVVCGCFSANNTKEMQQKDIIWLGNNHKNEIPDILLGYKINTENKIEQVDLPPPGVLTRAFLKIQDGCNFMCSYCIIPFVRGRQKSVPSLQVIEKIKTLIKIGYKEIILTGVNIAGYNDGNCNFYELLKKINEIKGDFRIRISSMEPFQVNEKLLNLLLDNKERWCQFFHLCLQNADDKILADMNRKYSIKQFKKIVHYIRAKNPLASISTDYIAGFPSETIEQFKKTLIVLKELNFSFIHLFPFSLKKGTKCELLKMKVDEKNKKERFVQIKKLQDSISLKNHEKYIGKEVNILFEKPTQKNIQKGHCEYDFLCEVKTNKNLFNTFKKAKVISFKGNVAICQLS